MESKVSKRRLIRTTGAALAIAAVGLASAGCQSHGEGGSAGAEEVVHCWGVNACSGHNDCKTAHNACKGQAKCAGHGFVNMTRSECEKKGGEVR